MQTLFTRHQPGRKTLPKEVKVNTLANFPGPRFIVMVMTCVKDIRRCHSLWNMQKDSS